MENSQAFFLVYVRKFKNSSIDLSSKKHYLAKLINFNRMCYLKKNIKEKYKRNVVIR